MFSFATRVALSALLVTGALAQTYQINTPLSVVVCQPALLSWTGGNPPYFLSILPAGQPSAPALLDLGQQSGTSVTWVANLQAGTSGFLNLRDSTGTLAQSGPFTVQSGTNSSCVGQTAVTSAGPGGQQPPATSASNSGSSSTSPTASKTGASATKAGPSGSSTPSSAATAHLAPVGFAAMVGAALLALAA